MKHLKVYEQESYDPFGEEKEYKVYRMIITADGRRVFASDAKTDQEIIDQMKKQTGCGEAEYGKLKVVTISETKLLDLKRSLNRQRNELNRMLDKVNYEYSSLFGSEKYNRYE